MTILLGAFNPGRMPVDIEHTFVPMTDDGLRYADDEFTRILGARRVPLLTIEWPRDGTPRNDVRAWGRLFRQYPRSVQYVRYMHEFNGSWGYPWQGDPGRFQRAWADFAAAMPTNVRRVWSPNVSYPGSGDLIRYWPHPGSVDVIGIDGYARNGETPAELFRPTLAEIAALPGAAGKPVWIAETGVERGRRQAKWWKSMMRWAESEGIDAVIAFNENKARQGRDERNWTLTPSAARAFLGEQR